jgi:hypothetical protein
MTRHTALFCFTLVAAIAGCSREQPAAQPAQVSADPAPSAHCVPAQEAASGFVYSPLPPGVTLSTRFIVRGDRIYTTKAGAQRRLATLELLEGDAPVVAQALVGQMTALGFTQVAMPEKDDGLTRLGFTRKDLGRVNIYATSDVGKSPFNPAAIGLLKFDWPASGSATQVVAPAE